MAFNVRVHGFRGLTQIPLIMPKQYSADSVFQLVYPQEWSQVVVVSAVAASTSPVALPDATQLIRVEVPDGDTIRFEINPPNRTGGVKAASTTSPILSGIQQFAFGPGWSISMVDEASFP